MNLLYDMVGITKQAHYKSVGRIKGNQNLESKLVAQVQTIRKDHQRMGLRTMYFKLHPEGIGRDGFEKLMSRNGLKVGPVRSSKRTTVAHPSSQYPNLLSGKELDGPNQVWVSDITYIRVGERFYYLTMIMDVYSRRILGWSLSSTLEAESNLRALKMALKVRNGIDLKGMIHHSDRGGQYIYGPYLKLLEDRGIRVSMGNKAWENAHAERINGIIKLDYIEPNNPQSWEELKRVTRRGIVLYNKDRPHSALERQSPVDFEKFHSGLAPNEKQMYIIKY